MVINANSNTLFDRHWIPEPMSGCWLWEGAVAQRGYGRFGVRKDDGSLGTASAHRYAFTRAYGEIPVGMQVCHSCDNKCCVNPGHMRLGVAQDNADDRVRRGRSYTSPKLTEAAILEMRRLRGEGRTQREIGKLVGCHQATVSLILGAKRRQRSVKPPPKILDAVVDIH